MASLARPEDRVVLVEDEQAIKPNHAGRILIIDEDPDMGDIV